MLLVDAHLDLAWNAIDWKRDLEESVAEMRKREAGRTEPGVGTNTVSLGELRKAGAGVVVATILARLHRSGNPMFGYATPEAAYAVARGQLAYYDAMIRKGKLRHLRTAEELDRHVAEWTTDPERTPIGFVLSMEGADPILDPDQVEDWWRLGLRAIGLTHYGKNRYGGGTASEDGLEPEARPLLAHMERLGMLLDLTHLSDAAFWQAIDWFGGRVLASHQNARHFVDHQRQFSDDQLRRVIERQGVIGAVMDAWMLQPGWIRGESRPEVTLAAVADQIDYVCQLAGNHHHAAIGSDLDGGFGIEQTPKDLDVYSDLLKIPAILEQRGYSGEAIAAIFHGNWLRLFRESLPNAAP